MTSESIVTVITIYSSLFAHIQILLAPRVFEEDQLTAQVNFIGGSPNVIIIVQVFILSNVL